MKKLALTIVLLFAASAFAQKTFDVDDASKFFTVKIKVASCEDDTTCVGKGSYSFYKKGSATPYQVVSLPTISVHLTGDHPIVDGVVQYANQSAVVVEDYNFDGMDDLSLSEGDTGPYGSSSYRVYLSTKATGKFVYSPAFSKALVGDTEIDKKKRTFSTSNKDGCCWHITEKYDVVAGEPRKIYEMVEDARQGKKVKVTTKTLVGDKWKTSVKYVKAETED